MFKSIRPRWSSGDLSPSAATLIGLVMVPQPNAEPEPPPSEAQGFEPNPMPGPTTNSPGPMAEDMDVEWIDEDTKFIAMPQDLVQEHFLVVDDVSGGAGRSVHRCLSDLLCPDLAFPGHFNNQDHYGKS
jgi:hypothetical protein